jgi:hypothetical protein
MVLDPEKDALEDSLHVPQDIDGPVEHPRVSTVRDDDTKKHDTGEGSIHSQSSSDTIEPAPLEEQSPQRSKSRSSSVRSRPLSIIPRSKRRGLLARLTVVPEVERPYEYKRSTKWLITFLVALAAAAAPMGSSIFFRELYIFLKFLRAMND